MRRALLLALLTLATAAAPARAALVERPFVTGGGDCLTATGAPSELATLGAGGIDLWSSDGPARSGHVTVPRQASCPAFATSPNGTTVMGVLVHRSAADPRARVAVALRPPGGTFGPLADLGATGTIGASFAVAVNDRADALVAWRQDRPHTGVPAVLAARTTAPGRWGTPELLQPAGPGNYPFEHSVAAGLDAAGAASVAWRRGVGTRIDVAGAAPGAAFTAPSRLGHGDYGSPGLAVAPDGRVLLAGLHEGVVELFERAPAAGTFARLPVPATDTRVYGQTTSVALAPSGAALVAWGDLAPGAVAATWRAAGGAFGAPRQLDQFGLGTSDSAFTVSDVEAAFHGVAGGMPTHPQALLADDGRGAVTWLRPAAPFSAARAQAATGDVRTGFARRPLGSRVRDALGVVPLLESGGVPAAAWADSDVDNGYPKGTRRLHTAAPGGIPAPSPAPPASRLRHPSRIALYRGESLPVRVRCSAACDVRAWARGSSVSRHRSRAGTVRLAIPAPDGGFGTTRGRHVPVRVLVSAAGGHAVARQRASVWAFRRPSLPLPRIFAVRARRSGDHVVLSWRVRSTARRAVFTGALTRRRSFGSAIGYREARGGPAHRYRMVLRPLVRSPHWLASAHWAVIAVGSMDSERQSKPLFVRIR